MEWFSEMFCLVNKKILNSINPTFVLLLIAAFVLSGCGGNSKSSDTAPSGLDVNMSFQLPDSIFGTILSQGAGTLTATISVNGGTPQPMTIAGTTASATVTNIPAGSTTFTILFTYDLAPYGPLEIARAEKTFTITTGTNLIGFSDSNYDTTAFDADGDGLSNIAELDVNSKTSPVVALCKIGTTQLGQCELGS